MKELENYIDQYIQFLNNHAISQSLLNEMDYLFWTDLSSETKEVIEITKELIEQ